MTVGEPTNHPELAHPDLTGVAGAMREEWRADQEGAAADAAAQWRHTRRLADWFTQRMHAGDRVAVTIAGERFAGLVVEIGPDHVALQAAFGRVDLHLVPGASVVIEIVDKVTEGGERALTSRSFHDSLLARDAQPDVSVGTLHDPEGIDGTLYVGADFVSVIARLGAETVVPLSSVVWVSPRRV